MKVKLLKKEIEAVVLMYGLGELVRYKEFTAGSVQTNIMIETQQSRFVLKCYKTRSKESALFELNLLNRLSKITLPIAKPLKSLSGDLLVEHDDKLCAIMHLLEGSHAKNPNDYSKVDQANQVVKALATLHKNTCGYKPKNYQLRDSYDPECCQRTAKIFVKKLKSKTRAGERMKWLNDELESVLIPKNIPKGVCHCDTHCSNFLFKGSKLTGMIDFDDSGYTWLIYDIANLLYFWAWKPEKGLDFTKAKKLIDEYQKHRKLNASEKKYLFDVLKMVILMSASWFIHADDDFKQEQERIDYLNKIGRDAFQDKLFN
ncbi:MAG: homoserine kinase [Patescibacteria group bacterium]